MEDVEIEDLGSVESYGNPQAKEVGVEVLFVSYPREGILMLNPRSKVAADELGKIRYLNKIPKCVEIRAPEAHKRVDWVIPG